MLLVSAPHMIISHARGLHAQRMLSKWGAEINSAWRNY